MKCIPLTELLEILEYQSSPGDVASEDYMQRLFNSYGDEFYTDRGSDRWELCVKNSERVEYLKRIRGESNGSYIKR